MATLPLHCVVRISINSIYAALALASIAGCQKSGSSDLDLNGYFSSHTSVMQSHHVGEPSEVFALATLKLDSFAESVTDDLSCEAFLVPQVSGYQVRILSRKRLSEPQERSIIDYVDVALSEARREAKSLIQARE